MRSDDFGAGGSAFLGFFAGVSMALGVSRTLAVLTLFLFLLGSVTIGESSTSFLTTIS